MSGRDVFAMVAMVPAESATVNGKPAISRP